MVRPFPRDAFSDLLAHVEGGAGRSADEPRTGRAARGLAVVTCIDARIDPLRLLGLEPGDAVVARTAGARVTDDVLKALIVASHLLAVERVLVLAHSDCRMASGDEAALHAAIAERSGIDTRDLVLGAIPDQRAALTEDVERLRASAHLPEGLVVGAAMLDVADGLITPVEA
jgi:carbonic anhydrase